LAAKPRNKQAYPGRAVPNWGMLGQGHISSYFMWGQRCIIHLISSYFIILGANAKMVQDKQISVVRKEWSARLIQRPLHYFPWVGGAQKLLTLQ
jgi:hypothetical protein